MRTALVLIDLINDLIHPDGAMPTCAADVQRRGVLSAANQSLEHARARGWPTLLVKVGFRAGYPELPAHAPLLGRARELGALRLGQWGTEFHADLAVQPGDPVLVKHRLSPFHGTALATLLGAAGIERLLLGASAPPGPCRRRPGRATTGTTGWCCWRTPAPRRASRSTRPRSSSSPAWPPCCAPAIWPGWTTLAEGPGQA